MRALWLILLLSFAAGGAGAATCRSTIYDGAAFTWCQADVVSDGLRLWHYDARSEPYGTFAPLDRDLRRHGTRLGVAMNAGMFHPDRSAVGLYIEDWVEQSRLITRDVSGNFGLLPNGVLCIGEGWARVVESRRFAASPPACRYATQSGPLLLIGGALHPRFLVRSDSLHIRNGVGVRPDGRGVVMAISDEPVNFHHFARFFRDVAKTPDALYLDGSVSRLYAPSVGRRDGGRPLGPILGTVAPAG